MCQPSSICDIDPLHTATIHTFYNFFSSIYCLFNHSLRFCAFRPLQFFYTCTLSLIFLECMTHILYLYYNIMPFMVFYLYPPLCVERFLVTVLFSNHILRGNVQHPRYEPLRVQILRERLEWRSSVRQKKLWYPLVGLCHGFSGIQHFKLKYLTDNPETDWTCNITKRLPMGPSVVNTHDKMTIPNNRRLSYDG